MTGESQWKRSRQKLVPRSEQIRGMELIVKNGGTRLFLHPGKGKTAIVLKAFSVLKKLDMVDCLLVLAPLRVITTSWPQQLDFWEDFEHLTFRTIHGGKTERLAAMASKADVYLMNVEGLLTSEWKLGPETRGRPCNNVALAFLQGKRVMLAVDESTKFKNSQSGRFKTLKKYLKYFCRRIVMTGTPKPNLLEDLFAQCYITDMGEDLGEYITHFRNNYMALDFDGKYIPQLTGEDRVAEKIAPTTLQLEDTEAIPTQEINVWVPMPEAAKEMYKKLAKDFIVEIEGQTVMAPNAGVLFGKLRQFCQGAIWTNPDAEELVEVHEAKLDALENLLEELNGSPAFCLYPYRHDVSRISKRLGRAVPHIGSGVSAAVGAAHCAAFGMGAIPLLLGQPQSVAHGVDGLQHSCNNVIWFGLDPSWENTYQANRRIARSGTKADQVFIYRIMMECPLEHALLEIVSGKQQSEENFLAILRKYLVA
jgi:hypothetical protein